MALASHNLSEPLFTDTLTSETVQVRCSPGLLVFYEFTVSIKNDFSIKVIFGRRTEG